MAGYIGVTDQFWFSSHKSHNRSEVLFWRKAVSPVDLDAGDYFFFLVKGNRLVEGCGFVSEIGTDTINNLFDKYKEKTGWTSIDDAEAEMSKKASERIGYYLLRDVQYFENEISLEEIGVRFEKTTVSGRRIDETEVQRILDSVGQKIIPSKIVTKQVQTQRFVNRRVGYIPELTLESFLAQVPEQIESGLKLLERQKITEAGRIDLLCQDKNNNLVVIEEKTRQTGREVVGQIQSYMQWITENYAKKEQDVRGIIIIVQDDKNLMYAARANPKIKVKKLIEYNFTFENI